MSNRWIPLKDRLPEENQNVWVTNEYHGGDRRVEESVFKNGEFYTVFCRYVTCTDLVKAWCPRSVPQPYWEES